jgi:fused signal recognition particle receptor
MVGSESLDTFAAWCGCKDADIVIIRYRTFTQQSQFVNELLKVKRVMQVVADAPHDVLLVLDGST